MDNSKLLLTNHVDVFLHKIDNYISGFNNVKILCITDDDKKVYDMYKAWFIDKSYLIIKTHMYRIPLSSVFQKIDIMFLNCIVYIKRYVDLNKNSLLQEFNQYLFM